MSAGIEAMREAFRQLSNGQATLPVRECINAAEEHGVALVMPCHSTAQKLFSIKFTTIFNENTQRNLPLIQSLVILSDGATGEHLAVMDGASVTALRTGAASGVATDLLARPALAFRLAHNWKPSAVYVVHWARLLIDSACPPIFLNNADTEVPLV
jgi:ornithine cyclodeaminase/alanine dehydrogenase-like protein (mu-crystallin family)